MAKSERKLVDKYAQQQMKDVAAQTGEDVNYLKGQRDTTSGRAEQSYGEAREAATGLLGGGMNPYATSMAAGVSNPFATELAKGTANPYATNLAVTGGISEDEAQKMETAATRGVRSVYDVAGAEAKRRAAITGGYGGAGEIAQIARKSGQAQKEALTDAQAKIAGIRQGGRVSGAGMVGGAQEAGAGMIGAAQTAGTGMINQQILQGAQNLMSMYGLSQEQSNVVMDQILKARALGMNLTQGDIQLLAEMSRQPGAFSTAVGAIGTIGGAAAGVMGGIGAIK